MRVQTTSNNPQKMTPSGRVLPVVPLLWVLILSQETLILQSAMLFLSDMPEHLFQYLLHLI